MGLTSWFSRFLLHTSMLNSKEVDKVDSQLLELFDQRLYEIKNGLC